MKQENYSISTDQNEEGWCIYCDRCGSYITTVPDFNTQYKFDPLKASDWLCAICEVDDEHNG